MQSELLGATMAKTAGAQQPAAQSRLAHAAHEFEAQMMKELLKPMTEGGGIFEDDPTGSSGVLGDFAAEALAQGVSEQGGFGIADRIVRELSKAGNGTTRAAVTGTEHTIP